jgi:hypothetical protein
MWHKRMTHNNWHNEQYMMAKRSEVVNTARLLRDGKMSVVEGAWRLNALRHEVTQNDFDDDFMLFVAIASETDHLPVGEVRKQYATEALVRADKEIEEVDKIYRSQVEVACEKLIARFSHAT